MMYAIVKGGRVVQAPVALTSRYQGVRAFHRLTDAERKQHGWYPCISYGYNYDPETQVQEGPTFEFTGEVVKMIYHNRPMSQSEYAQREAEKLARLLADLAAHRYEIETSGITLPDGTRVLTDRESQGQLANAYQSLSQPFVDAIDWKAPSGWVTVTEPELRPIAQAVAQHVQGCFTAERRVSEQIEAGEVVDVRAAFDDALVGVLD